MEKRVYGEKISIDPQNTVNFFDQRAKTIKNRKQEYTTVLLGDQDPDSSVRWDEYEKQFLLSRFELNKSKSLLDLGCGIGRLAEAFSDCCREYVGIDFSSEMIAVAKEKIKNENCHFYTMSVVDAVSDPLVTSRQYDIVIDAGVSMYINDDELRKYYQGLRRLAHHNSLFYFEESVGKEERLTLNHIWSENLKDYYGAIYRTREEYKSLLAESMQGLEYIEEGYMAYLDHTEEAETSHWYALFRIR